MVLYSKHRGIKLPPSPAKHSPPFQVPLKSVKCPSLPIPPSMLFFFRDPQNLIVSRKRLKTRRKAFLKMIALFQNKKLRIFFIK